jgi:hypothetical protein
MNTYDAAGVTCLIKKIDPSSSMDEGSAKATKKIFSCARTHVKLVHPRCWIIKHARSIITMVVRWLTEWTILSGSIPGIITTVDYCYDL